MADMYYNARGGLTVDRESLHQSEEYKRQIRALEEMRKPSMTKLLDDLSEVVRLSEAATQGKWMADGDDTDFHTITVCGDETYACSVGIWQTPRHMGRYAERERVANAQAIPAAMNFIRTHAAEIERNARDAARYRWLCNANGYFMEEHGLCGYTNDKPEADQAIDIAMRERGGK